MITIRSLRYCLLIGGFFIFWTGCGGCDEVGGGEFGDDVGVVEDVGQDTGPVDEGDAGILEGECTEEQEGTYRQCGTDVGECRFGAQGCYDGEWGPCQGGVQPRPEQCDGLDNSCSGAVDDGEHEDMCQVASRCTETATCVEGACVVEEIEGGCSYLDEPCYLGVCTDDKEGECEQEMVEDGTACDDGDFCTVAGSCSDGVCETVPRDCSDLDDQCNVGVCDSEAQACVTEPAHLGESCEDDLFCTANTTCTEEGTCEGEPTDCSAAGDQCNEGVCNEEAQACEPEPFNIGEDCDDELACTINTTCTIEGTCEGEPLDCSAAGGQECIDGVCDEEAGGCVGEPINIGQSCNEDLFCVVGSLCTEEGSCEGTPRDCSSLDDQCNVGICDEAAGACVAVPINTGESCDDDLFCTVNTTCSASGTCEGQPRDCSGEDDQCNEGICDEAAGSCVAEPTNIGQTCDDGLACTVNNTCSASGTCEGQPRDCSGDDDQCNEGICDESVGGCVADPVNIGQTCDDELFCTVGTICTDDGGCEGIPRDCSDLDDQCNVGICDEAAGACVAAPINIGDSCDDDLFCTVNTTCSASGTCEGQARDCSGEGDQCNEGVCDEAAESCVADPINIGESCDDELFCTVNNTCTIGGTCEGQPRDCSGEDDQGNEGICDESADSCVAEPTNIGDSCDDELFCTVNTTCTIGGTCEGQARDCSGEDDQCNEGICDESADSCVAEPTNIGDSCDDELYCTVNTTCSVDGTCEGQARDCSGEGDQCNEGVCDESAQTCVAEPTNIGGTCDDGLYCTVNTLCTADGSCEGEDRSCAHLDELCQVGYCDEALSSCELTNVADQTECDTGVYCSVNEVCEDGICVGDPRDCSALDQECYDGVCDEAGGECIAIFTCDPCDDGTPTADAGPDQDVLPNTPVTLDGSGSSDPNDQDLSYEWRIDSRPDGSSANLSSTTAESPTILADVAGEYEICLTVTNPDECTSGESCMTLTITPGDGLHIELTWDPAPGEVIDLDLHYRAPGGSWFSYYIGPPGQSGCGGNADSVWFCTPNPDWGGDPLGSPDGDPDNDPYLDIDDEVGDAPENINQDVLFDGQDFRVGVHHWTDNGYGPEEARVRIYFNGFLEFEEFRTIACGEFWEVATIDVTNDGNTIDITSLNDTFFGTGYGACP